MTKIRSKSFARLINLWKTNDVNNNNVWKQIYSFEETLRFYTIYPKSLESSFSMTGMHQRWYRCEAKSHTLAVAHMHWCTRDGCSGRYTWLCIYNRSAVVPIVSGRRDAAELEKGRAMMEFEAKSSISSIDLPASCLDRFSSDARIPRHVPFHLLKRSSEEDLAWDRRSKENRSTTLL